MNKLHVITIITLSLSVAAHAESKTYKCIGNDSLGSKIQNVKVSFEKGILGKIGKASVDYDRDTYSGIEHIQKNFRSPVKIPKETAENPDAYLSGANNSRINPFGDFDYLSFANHRENVKFEDLSSKLNLSLYSFYGSITNRMSQDYALDCDLE